MCVTFIEIDVQIFSENLYFLLESGKKCTQNEKYLKNVNHQQQLLMLNNAQSTTVSTMALDKKKPKK